jgi:hypothetical protein
MEHPYGSFCFAEVQTPDVEGAKRFYGELFGWNAVRVPTATDYFIFQLQGKDIIGLRRAAAPQRLVGYVRVEHVDGMAARATELGATMATPVVDIPGMARTCVLEDPEGATFGLWESRGHGGAHVQNQTGTMWWVELLARDIQAARRFYVELFGWSYRETQKYGNDLTIFKIGNESVASALEYGPDWGVTQRWHVFFAVDDWDTAVERTDAMGGELEFCRDVPNAGRLGIIRDPGRAAFCIVRPDPAPATTGI